MRCNCSKSSKIRGVDNQQTAAAKKKAILLQGIGEILQDRRTRQVVSVEPQCLQGSPREIPPDGGTDGERIAITKVQEEATAKKDTVDTDYPFLSLLLGAGVAMVGSLDALSPLFLLGDGDSKTAGGPTRRKERAKAQKKSDEEAATKKKHWLTSLLADEEASAKKKAQKAEEELGANEELHMVPYQPMNN